MNILALTSAARLLLSLIPVILAAMKQVEDVLGNAPGATKLEVVRLTLQAAFAKEQDMEHTFESLWPTLSGLISVFKGTPALFPPKAPQ
jgi:hypothetical protein